MRRRTRTSRARNHGQCLLLLDCPKGDRTQYPWIESGVPCKLLRIGQVALAVVTTDGMQLGDVGDDHLVPVLFQLLRDPDRINTGFHDNSRNGSIDSPLEPQPAPSLHQDSSSRAAYGNPVESNMLSNEPRNNNKSRSPIKEKLRT
jgi:hypothetical protein